MVSRLARGDRGVADVAFGDAAELALTDQAGPGLADWPVDVRQRGGETTVFPVSRALYMFTPGWPKGDTLNFINFVVHPEKGQKYVREAGFVPLY